MATESELVKKHDKGYNKLMKLIIDEPTYYNKIMYRAAEGGHIEIVKLMLEKGATDYNRVMYKAAKGGHMDIVKCMLEKEQMIII